MATMTAHVSKSSVKSLKDLTSMKNTNSLVSVRLSNSSKNETEYETEYAGDEITMHFPDETEIARSSLGSSVGSAKTMEEKSSQVGIGEVKVDQASSSSSSSPPPNSIAKRASEADPAKGGAIVKGRKSVRENGASTSIGSVEQTIISKTRQSGNAEEETIKQDNSKDASISIQEDVPLTPLTAQFEDNEKTPKPASQRMSKVRFDMEKIRTEPIQISPDEILHEHDESQEEKRDSDLSTLSYTTEEDSLAAELARTADLERRESESSDDTSSELVDWQELDRTEGEEQRDEATDESMAFLLARLDKENNALATDPKANITSKQNGRIRSTSRPPSLHMIKKLVNEPTKPQLRYSLSTPPLMTELEFWSALVRDYPTTAQRLPTLTSNKIRNGIPPPLRGVVWQSIAGARDPLLEDEYIRLSVESSPYEKMIHKDVGRSFPGVDMFKDPSGQGQRMLSKVLNAFSLFDQEIGYCQGLGFVVGPLLMHMGDKEAFCVLIRLMSHYDLRSCFLPSLRGLHLRIYQFQHLLAQHLPELTAHLEALKVEPLYLSQWFLSFFGVTCPLPMLIRIYDVILTEGASETLMRVALSLMRRNAPKILATLEFEDIMHLLLSRSLWDTYGCNADDLVSDFVGWTGLVTREGLASLEASFDEKEQSDADKPGIHSAASRFLGRFWTGNNVTGKIMGTPMLSMPVKNNHMSRSPSKQSVASTLNSIESSEGHHSTMSTAATSISQDANADDLSLKPTTSQSMASNMRGSSTNQDKDLHSQIEDLLIALSNLQREHSALADDLQQEREQREEDKAAVVRVLGLLNNEKPSVAQPENHVAVPEDEEEDVLETLDKNIKKSILELEVQFTSTNKRSSLALQTKQQLREEASRWKNMYSEEAIRTASLTTQLNEKDKDASSLKDDLRQARARIADSHREQQRLEKLNQELKIRKTMAVDTSMPPPDSPRNTSPAAGLREFRLGRISGTPPATFSRRTSSLVVREAPPAENNAPPADDALLHELIKAKTAEAAARQELEEVKAKLDSFRKLMNTTTAAATTATSGHAHSSSVVSMKSVIASTPVNQEPKKDIGTAPSSYATGGFFSGWGKRSTSGTS